MNTEFNNIKLKNIQKFAVVIPAFNESSNIEKVVRQVSLFARAIVVDDGSVDDTADIAQSAGAYIVRHQFNRGYDCALESGMITARALGCEFVVTMDADGQHNPDFLNAFINKFNNGYELIIGYRGKCQRWSEKLYSIIAKILWNINDPLCGMKGYNLKFFNKNIPIHTFESVGSELAIRGIKKGAKTCQIKIKTNQRIGYSRFGNGIKPNIKICRAIYTALTRFKSF